MPNSHTLDQNMQRLITARTSIADAIVQKGGTVSQGDGFEDFPDDIASITNTYTVQDEGKVVSNGALVTQGSDTVTQNGTVDTTLISELVVDVSGGGGAPKSWNYTKPDYILGDKKLYLEVWSAKTWSGLSSLNGNTIWTDGDNIYYSNGNNQYVLNKATSTWKSKTWSGLSRTYGSHIWTDGDNIYYNNAYDQYVLNKATSRWNSKTWSGLSPTYGLSIWTDGDNIYFSDGSDQYVLDKATSTWNSKTWSGLSPTYGNNIWTDGDNIYYSDGSDQYVLDKATSTWNSKTWSGLTSFSGNSIWTDGDNIYYSKAPHQYVLTITEIHITNTVPTVRAIPRFS